MFCPHSFCRRAAALWGAVLGLSLASTAGSVSAEEFYLKDPLDLGAANITIDSQIRPLRGTISGFDGRVAFDPTKPEKLQGDLRIDLMNLRVGSFLVTEVLLSELCLDAAHYPTLKFSIKGVRDVKELTENNWSFTAMAAMGLRGRAGRVDFPATVTYVPDGMTERSGGKVDGDLIVLRGELSFEPADWGVSVESEIIGAIGSTVEVDFSTIGYTMRSARRSGSD